MVHLEDSPAVKLAREHGVVISKAQRKRFVLYPPRLHELEAAKRDKNWSKVPHLEVWKTREGWRVEESVPWIVPSGGKVVKARQPAVQETFKTREEAVLFAVEWLKVVDVEAIINGG